MDRLSGQPLLTPAWTSLADRAYGILERKIITLELAPGQVISEAMLMQELGMGRTPIREALQRLAKEHLVVILPRRGIVVADVSVPGARQLYEFREVVEGFIARQAAERATPAERDEMRRLREETLRAARTGDTAAFIECDRRFHRRLAAIARNVYAEDTIGRLHNLSLRFWYMYYREFGGVLEAARVHARVMAAVARADGETAELAMRELVAEAGRLAREAIDPAGRADGVPRPKRPARREVAGAAGRRRER